MRSYLLPWLPLPLQDSSEQGEALIMPTGAAKPDLMSSDKGDKVQFDIMVKINKYSKCSSS